MNRSHSRSSRCSTALSHVSRFCPIPEQPQLPIAPDAVEADMRTLLHGRNVKFVDWAGWLRVDAEEKLRGVASKKPREKLTSVAEMLRVAS